MRFPDPFTHPGLVPGFSTADLIDNDPVIRDELPNNRVLEAKSSAQYWGISISLPDLYPEEFRLIDSIVCEYKRTGDFFTILLPQYENLHVTAGQDKATIPAGQSGSSISIRDTTLAIKGAPKPGDLFQLSNHPKVYKITSVTISPNKTTIGLGLYPDLFVTTVAGATPIFNGVLFQVKLSSDSQTQVTQSITEDGMYSGVAFSFREAV